MRSSANLRASAETQNLSKERSCGQVGNPKQISEAMGREDCSFNFDRVVHNALKVFSRYGIQIKQETGATLALPRPPFSPSSSTA